MDSLKNKRVLVFGGHPGRCGENSRYETLCNVLELNSKSVQYCSVKFGFETPGSVPQKKIIYALVTYFFRCIAIVYQYTKARPHDYIIVPFPSYLDSWLACLLGRFNDKIVVVDLFVGLYDSIVSDRKLIDSNGVLATLIKKYEKLVCRFADSVLVDTLSNVVMLKEQTGIFDSTINSLPVGINENLWKQLPILKNKPFQVIYWCTFSPLHGVDVVADSAKIIQDMGLDIKFLCIGTGQLAYLFREMINDKSIKNIIWIDRFIPIDQIQKYVSQSDCCLGIFSKNSKTQRVVPYKVQQALASGRPIITARSTEIDRFFRNRVNALLVTPDDASSLADAIIELYNNSGLANSIGAEGRKTYEKFFSNIVFANQLDNILMGINCDKEHCI